MMISGPLSRVMMVRQPFGAKKNAEFTLFVLKLVPLVRYIFATDLSVIVIEQNRKQFNTTAGVQKPWHCTVL